MGCVISTLVKNRLKINGKEKEFAGAFPGTILELLAELKINEATVVAEIEGKIIKRQDFSGSKICPGQSIELLHLVGGG